MYYTTKAAQTTKALIRLRGCTCWSAPLLFAYAQVDLHLCCSRMTETKKFSHDVARIVGAHWTHSDLIMWLLKTKNDLCAQRRLRSAWASAQSDRSSLSAWRNLGSFTIHWAHSEDSDQTGCPGWSEFLQGAQFSLLVLSCCCSALSKKGI